MEIDEINIAYDQKKKVFVAYNVDAKIVVTGVCVESACDAYRNRYYEIQAEMANDDYVETILP